MLNVPEKPTKRGAKRKMLIFYGIFAKMPGSVGLSVFSVFIILPPSAK